MKKNMKTRVAELSATLTPMSLPYTESAYDEMWGGANDFISYNSPYYCNGLQRVDYDGGENTCVLEKVDEFQVMRFFQVKVYMSGECMYNYYANEFENQEDPNWMDDDFYEPDELEVRGVVEYKQIWIGHDGEIEIVNLADNFVDGLQCYAMVDSLQPWAYEPVIKSIIFDNICEYKDFCYAVNEYPTLEFSLSHTAEFTHKEEPEFYNVLVSHGLCSRGMKYFRTFKVAHRHGYTLPTDYNSAITYLNYLELLDMANENYLTQPYYVCPDDLQAAYDRMNSHRKELLEQLEKRKAAQQEFDFKAQHSYLFGIEFDSENFHFKSLDSVEEYRIEGNIMHHCIYNHQYFNNVSYLAMHITDFEGNRVATCTVDVFRREIDQIQPMCDDIGYFKTYGIDWKTTNEYKEIWNCLMARMHTFPKYKPVKKESTKEREVA